ncbi:(deoxy)nucleoside triphosphate pyrophosphohydrolase [Enterococcus dongliensis]|uniref:(deoxy)nucleoside triphosphate pyrophosphohydrolase n=1 Tax=Enterococcus dongliensis TaxID=2559925 RepID=UPI002890FD60|nr:(deoxy)nucleoside triphosphate pyrophosphohydrolase [Enterococcus dongliensis]MDT2613913.1 (deoxy)nucleoside triphosphate pyrophosphohydrolase [Enterococcus dongliensis]
MGKKNIFVVGAVLVQDDKILCCQRGPGRSLANLWEFPGGKIETGEHPVEALKRELSEELNIQVSITETEFVTTAYEYDFGIVHLTTFICHLEKGKPVLTEHTQIKWLKPAQLNELNWAPADLPTVDKLMTEGVWND